MNNLIWKYGRSIAECNCHNIKRTVNFTTLCPMFNPKTAEDCKIYHENIDYVSNKLKYLGFEFWNGTVMLVSHSNIDKKQLRQY